VGNLAQRKSRTARTEGKKSLILRRRSKGVEENSVKKLNGGSRAEIEERRVQEKGGGMRS